MLISLFLHKCLGAMKMLLELIHELTISCPVMHFRDGSVRRIKLQQDYWNSKHYTSSKAHRIILRQRWLSGHTNTHKAFRWLWKSSCQLLKVRLSSRNIVRRKGMVHENYNCVVCSQRCEELVEHLFLDCSFAKVCWNQFCIPSSVTVFQLLEIF